MGFSPLLPPVPVAVALFAWVGFQARYAVSGSGATRVFTGCLLGFAVGAVYGHSHVKQQLPASCVKQPLTVEGRIVSLPESAPSPFGGLRTRFHFELTKSLPQHCGHARRLQLSYYGNEKILPGQHWSFNVRLKQARGLSNPGGFDAQYWFTQTGIVAVGAVKGDGTLVSAPELYTLVNQRWRFELAARIRGLPFSERVRAVLAALTIADKSGITPALWQQFAALGVNHLLVISGLHVGLVAGLGLLIGRALALPFIRFHRLGAWVPACTALAAAGSYMALAGFTLPTQRAFIMVAVFVLGAAVARSQPAVTGLLYAATLILLVNPLAALGSGFWLSFGAVLGLLWLGRWQRGIPVWRQFIGTHTYMTLVMFPLGAFFFGGASVVALFANALLIPLIGLVVVPLALAAALAHLLGLWWEWAFWLLAGELLEIILQAIEQITRAQGAPFFRFIPPGPLVVILGLAACVLLVLPLHWRWRVPLLLLPAALLLPSQGAQPEQPQPSTSVTALDVGQGTAVVVRSGHRALLYDTGGGTPGEYTLSGAVVIPYLRAMGVTQLDTLVISHQDADHSAGVAEVLQAFGATRVRYGGRPGHGTDTYYAGRPCRAGEAWRWPGGQVFRMLAPARETSLNSNNGSCVLQLEYAGTRVLLTGDIDGQRECTLVKYWRNNLASELLLAGHHGSKTSSYWSFLKWVAPGAAIFSAGYANRFGHPHPDIVERYASAGVRQYETAQSGAVTLQISATGELTLIENREALRPYWM